MPSKGHDLISDDTPAHRTGLGSAIARDTLAPAHASGASLGFPVGMSAAADDPARAPARVSVVASIGYTAFLAGPPLIGLLAESAGIQRALLVAVAALVLGLLAAGAARPLSPAPARSS